MELLICEMVHFGCLHAGILLMCIMRALLLGPQVSVRIVHVIHDKCGSWHSPNVGVDMSQVIMHIQYICVTDAVQ